METSPVTITVLSLVPTQKKSGLMALADVEVVVDGVSMTIHGVQLLADGRKTAVRLPRYRALDGTWLAAITVPEEIRVPLANAVMAAGIEAKLLVERQCAE